MACTCSKGATSRAQDDTASPPVAIVNRAMAEALWPGRSAIGQRMRLKKDGPPVEVVGLTSNMTMLLLGEEDRPVLLLPLRQHVVPADGHPDAEPSE